MGSRTQPSGSSPASPPERGVIGKVLILTGAFCVSIGLFGVTTGRISGWAALLAVVGGLIIIVGPYARSIWRDRPRNPYEEG